MTGSVVSVLESVRARPVAAGSWVRSIDYGGINHGHVKPAEYAYSQYPPPLLQFTKHNTRLLCFDRVDCFAIGKASGVEISGGG